MVVNTAQHKELPARVQEVIEFNIGRKVDSNKIFFIPSDGFSDHHHGTFDRYIFISEQAMYEIRDYEDGHVEFKR